MRVSFEEWMNHAKREAGRIGLAVDQKSFRANYEDGLSPKVAVWRAVRESKSVAS